MPVSHCVNDSTYTYTQGTNLNHLITSVVEFSITKNYPARGEYTSDL